MPAHARHLSRLRWEDCEFEATPGYPARLPSPQGAVKGHWSEGSSQVVCLKSSPNTAKALESSVPK